MLVLCVGMFRSCSTWQYDIASHLVETYHNGLRLGFLSADSLDQQSDLSLTGIDTAGWRTLKSHDVDERFGRWLASGETVGIYAFRDLRDVVFSLAHKFGVDFDEIVERRGMVERIITNHRFWSSQPGMLHQRYEKIVANPIRAVHEIASHLGVGLRDVEAAAIAAEYSFESNLRRTQELGRELTAAGIDLADSQNALRFDPTSLLHWNHLREGRVGSWREQATRAQSRRLSELCGAWLAEQGY